MRTDRLKSFMWPLWGIAWTFALVEAAFDPDGALWFVAWCTAAGAAWVTTGLWLALTIAQRRRGTSVPADQ